VIFAPADEARMLGPEHGGSDPGLSAAEGWRDPDAAADLSLFLYLPCLWSGFAPSSQPLSAQAGRSAMGGSAGGDLARSAEILLR
jgi:hypothetical protein